MIFNLENCIMIYLVNFYIFKKGTFIMHRQIKFLKNELTLIDETLAFIGTDINGSGCFFRDPRGYYYLQFHANGERKNKYLGKIDSELVIAQKEKLVKQRLSEALQNDRLAIATCLHSLTDISPLDIPYSLPSKYAGIDVDIFQDERMNSLFEWAKEDYPKNNMDYTDQLILSCDGTRMRSKGECLWYNLLYESWLPFRDNMLMEMVNLDGKREWISPDFVLKCYDGSYILIDHMGLLLDSKYAAKNTNRIRVFLNNGYVIGKDLFITSDDKYGGTDSKSMKALLDLIKNRVLQGAPPHVVMMYE